MMFMAARDHHADVSFISIRNVSMTLTLEMTSTKAPLLPLNPRLFWPATSFWFPALFPPAIFLPPFLRVGISIPCHTGRRRQPLNHNNTKPHDITNKIIRHVHLSHQTSTFTPPRDVNADVLFLGPIVRIRCHRHHGYQTSNFSSSPPNPLLQRSLNYECRTKGKIRTCNGICHGFTFLRL